MNYGIIYTELKGIMMGGCKGIMTAGCKGVMTGCGDYFGIILPW